MKKIIITIVVVLVVGCSCYFLNTKYNGDKSPNKLEKNNASDNCDDLFCKYYSYADSILKDMSLEEKVGQLFLVRYDNNLASSWVRNYNPGGFILFARDFKDHTKESISDEIKSLQDTSKVPLVIGVDEEGGFVTRVSRYKNFRDNAFSSPRSIYEEGGYELLEKEEREKAQLLLSLGINLNLAPVVDVSTDENDFIHNRAFGGNSEETAVFAKKMVSYANSEGISSCLKHFPGYGNNVDTHNGIAIDDRSYDSFTSNDYLPFKSGIEEKVPAILVSHNIINSMDSSHPASLSEKVISELREKLNFSGIIITDDLSMGAVQEYVSFNTAAVLAVKAGNDMLITSDFKEMYNSVLEAVENGDISEKRVDNSVRRIIAWKKLYNM